MRYHLRAKKIKSNLQSSSLLVSVFMVLYINNFFLKKYQRVEHIFPFFNNLPTKPQISQDLKKNRVIQCMKVNFFASVKTFTILLAFLKS